MTNGDLRETRKQFFSEMEQKLQETYPKEEDRMFYYHSSEDRIVMSHALFWVMTQLHSWGLSALEGIVRGNEDDMKDSYIPSFIYYGVDDPKSLAMRMLGVPRSLSGSLSKVIEGNVNDYSFTRLRTILKGLNNNDWDSLCPQGSSLSGQEWKRVVDILMK